MASFSKSHPKNAAASGCINRIKEDKWAVIFEIPYVINPWAIVWLINA